ncbi:CAP domain-containing protein, partial [Filibacter tadaridae]
PEQPKPEPSTPEVKPEQPKPDETTQDASISAIEKAVLDLTNVERQKAGLAPLQIDSKLMNSARQKSSDMASKNYFSHTSPTYGSPFDQMKANGITYRSAAENIAQGQRSAEEVVKAWMESPGHRENILTPGFTHIGIGYDKDGNYWTQQFIQKR